jgi:predicted nucleic acid-binding protein
MNSPVVIDANLAVFSVLKTPYSAAAVRVMEDLAQRGFELFAPGLWWYEVTSVIHRYRFASIISDTIAYQALELLTVRLGVQKVEVPARNAYDWASRLRQKAAYDGFYLAAAEQTEAELWTADQALANNARQIGVSWVHLANQTEGL